MPIVKIKRGLRPVAALDNNALNNAIQGAADGAFASFTVSNSIDLDPSDTGNASFSYSYPMSFDPVNKRLYNHGGCHGISAVNIQRQFLAQYNIATNAWTSPMDAVAGGISATDPGGTHGFNMWGCDFQDGSVWGTVAYFSSTTLRKRTSAGVWSTPSISAPPRTNSTNGVSYHPGLYGGRGGLIWVSDGGIWSIDHRTDLGGSGTGQWILDRYNSPNGFLDAMGDAGTVHAWNYTDSSLYVGGGSVNKIWKIPGDSGAGTPVLIATSPITPYVWDDFNNTGLLISAGRGGYLKLIQRDGPVYEYNHNADSWSGQIATLDSGILAAPSNEIAVGTVPLTGSDYGAIVFFKRDSSLFTDTTGYIWRV